ncbi:unnamed protein product [Moneuplotes crassus]|uniref:Uncharacterized protein n=1 Tax=Euplotes crassus TaxID=5936 RepID=A0AAD1URP4_EUPCR|nr:unnamed protein product [Moneuplotes crassus]
MNRRVNFGMLFRGSKKSEISPKKKAKIRKKLINFKHRRRPLLMNKSKMATEKIHEQVNEIADDPVKCQNYLREWRKLRSNRNQSILPFQYLNLKEV